MAHHGRFMIRAIFSCKRGKTDTIHGALKFTTRPSRAQISGVQKAKLGRHEKMGAQGALTSNPERTERTPTVPRRRNLIAEELIARIPTVGVTFSAGSRHQARFSSIEVGAHRNCRADSANGHEDVHLYSHKSQAVRNCARSRDAGLVGDV